MAGENVTCPVFSQLTALKRHMFGTCSGGTSDIRVPGIRPTMRILNALGAEQELECLRWKEKSELDFFSPVRQDFAMYPGLT